MKAPPPPGHTLVEWSVRPLPDPVWHHAQMVEGGTHFLLPRHVPIHLIRFWDGSKWHTYPRNVGHNL